MKESKHRRRILHIAPQNISDVPMTLVRAERALGCESRLVTFFPDPRGYPEDYCLHLPLTGSRLVRTAKNWFGDPERRQVSYRVRGSRDRPPVWQPHNRLEQSFIAWREQLWQPRIRKMMREISFWAYDIYQFDAGLDFFRDGRTVAALKSKEKKIVVLYTGSDFRTRGVLPAVEQAANLRLTVEWDHLDLDATLQHVLFPFEVAKYPFRRRESAARLRIGHAPTNRAAKGSAVILDILREMATAMPIDIVLIENLPHAEAIRLKDSCDIFVDQIGDLGYGINALEALALGIPTCTCLTPRFRMHYPDHPFCEIDENSLRAVLSKLVENPAERQRLAVAGRQWVEQHHDSCKIAAQIHAWIDETGT